MRQLFLLTFLSAGLLLSFNSLATKLTIPEIFDVLKVDGQEHLGSIFSSDTILMLDQGEHSIELKYSELFENEDDDDHTFIRSDPFKIVFTITTPQDLLLSKPSFGDEEVDDDEEMARAYAENPTVKIGNSQQNIASITSEKVSKENTIKTSFLETPSGGASKTVVAPLIISSDNTSHTSPAIKKVTNITKTNVSLEKLAMLKYWWQQASVEEKATFKKFINQK